jgi:mutator protein MutT
MRKGIDHIGVGVGAVIFNAEGKVFLAKRGAAARNERHRWEFPGGCVEFGETLAHALTREIMEEYGFSIVIDGLLDVVDHILPDERQHWVSPTFRCRYAGGVPVIREPDKFEAIGWFSLSEIPRDRLTSASRSSLSSVERLLHAPPGVSSRG